jgi:hypothetical protein
MLGASTGAESAVAYNGAVLRSVRVPLIVLFSVALAAGAPRRVHAAAADDVPVPGGRSRFAELLSISPVPDRGRFLAESIRILYSSPAGAANATAVLTRRIDAYLDGVRRARVDATASDSVPVPLTAGVWSSAVFGRPVAGGDLVGAIVRDRRAALLCYGLSALDDETLEFFAANPMVLTRIYRRASAAFAAFGESFHVHQGRVVTPGGEPMAARWETAVGGKVTRPDQFILLLLELRKGRVAYVYDALAHADRAATAFALGSWNPGVDGDRRFGALVDVVTASFSEWDVSLVPFVRPPADLSTLLARVRVEPDGAPAGRLSRSFWQRVFGGGPVDERSAGSDEPADAAWLASATLSQAVVERGHRLDQLGFASRVFRLAAPEEQGDAAVAIRAFPTCPLLMLTLEQLGIGQPHVYATAAQRADRFSTVDPGAGYAALAQFQGALALVSRLARVSAIDRASAAALASELVEMPLDNAGRYDGAVIRWIEQRLRPRLPADLSADVALLAAAAGPSAPPPDIEWEGQRYLVDPAAAELRRLRRIREKQGGASIEMALHVAAAARRLEQTPPAAEGILDAIEELGEIARSLPIDPFPDAVTPPSIAITAPSRTIADAVSELSGIAQRNELQDAPRVGRRLAAAADLMVGETLVSFAYAFEIADPDGTMLIASDVSRRHDFGYGMPFHDAKLSSAWTVARTEVKGAPWHLAGSVLGLDLALAPVALRRIDAGRVPGPPRLTLPQREGFASAVGLVDIAATTDGDRDAVAAAIARGRQRVTALSAGTPDAVDALAGEVSLDGWRRRALQWTLVHDAPRALSLFSLSELLVAGGASPSAFAPWGANASRTDGCLCLRMPAPGEWRRWIGRPESGLPGLVSADVSLRVALALHDLRVPAVLQKFVLSAAMQDFIDTASPADSQDWLTLARDAQALPDSRIRDYVAAAGADGPLIPDTPEVR